MAPADCRGASTPFSSTTKRSCGTPLAASTRAADADGVSTRSARGEHRSQAMIAVLEERSVNLAWAAPTGHDERAGHPVGPNKELAGTAPPEVVHGDHSARSGGFGCGQKTRTQCLHGVEVHDVGLDLEQVLAEVGGHFGVVEVALGVPLDPRLRRHPTDGDPVLDCGEGVERGAVLVERAGVDAHFEPAVSETRGKAGRDERPTAHEVRWIVGRDDQQARAPIDIWARVRRQSFSSR